MDTTVLSGSASPRTDFRRQVYCLLGLPFDAVGRNQVVARIIEAVVLQRPCFLSTPNVNFVAAGLRDPAFRDSVIRSDLSVVDGMPLVWIARLLGLPLRERVAGSDLFETFLQVGPCPLKVYFFGGEDGVAEAACARVNTAAGRVRCAGWAYPGRGSVEQMSRPELIGRINRSGADFVAVALGAGKGQRWIERNRAALRAPVVSHLGAVVNFVAGTASRAPVGMRRLGLEWLWRIKEEPALWRRYLGDGAVLARLLLTRLAPALLQRALDAARPVRPPVVAAVIRAGTTRVTLSGSLRRESVSELRELLAAITRDPSDIELDMAGVTQADAGCLGSLMLLYGHQSRLNRALRVVAVSPAARRSFRLHCADFLLESLAGLGSDPARR